MSAPQSPPGCNSMKECEDWTWCVRSERCKRVYMAEEERAFREWHDRQMAKPFDERNFE